MEVIFGIDKAIPSWHHIRQFIYYKLTKSYNAGSKENMIQKNQTENLKNTIDLKDSEFDILAQKITKIYMNLDAYEEIINQCHLHPNIYKKYFLFLEYTWHAYFNEVIHGISCMFDKNSDTLSIVQMLQKYRVSKTDYFLKAMQESKVHKYTKTIRNKLGRAHLDYKISIDTTKQEELYKSINLTIEELYCYLDLLKEALSALAKTLDIPTTYLRPLPTIRSQIRSLFEELSEQNPSPIN
jgi:hypothetical protein